jgi:E3 ubiquitin-protein ligase MYCBP2
MTQLTVLQIGTPRLQRQAMVVVRRTLLQQMKPAACDKVLRPRVQFIRAHGLAGLLVALVAKAFTVQRRAPGVPMEMLRMEQVDGLRLEASVDWEIAKELAALLSDAALSEEWRAALAEKAAGALQQLVDSWSGADDGTTGDAAMWWAVGALSVLSDETAEELSSHTPRVTGGASAPAAASFCTNHDDGTTLAVLRCADCAPPPPSAAEDQVLLCSQCDHWLHLSRHTRGHRRSQLENLPSTMRISLKDGTARLKTDFGVLAVDRRNGKAVCELKQAAQVAAGTPRCRFCQAELAAGTVDVGDIDGVCESEDCAERALLTCPKVHGCGHPCGGMRGEVECLPCLHCAADDLFADADDYCNICWAENLASAPAVRVGCGHIFHATCLRDLLERRWPGPAITFGFTDCPCCKAELSHPSIDELMVLVLAMKDDVRRKAMTRLTFENKHNDSEVTDPNSRWHEDREGYAMDKYNYYHCHECAKPYFGGARPHEAT